MTAPATVVVVDDHELLAQSVCYALTARGLRARPLPVTAAFTSLGVCKARGTPRRAALHIATPLAFTPEPSTQALSVAVAS